MFKYQPAEFFIPEARWAIYIVQGTGLSGLEHKIKRIWILIKKIRQKNGKTKRGSTGCKRSREMTLKERRTKRK
jgi:hypothetical protein